MKTFKEQAREALDKIGYEDAPPPFACLLIEALERLQFLENALKDIGREDVLKDCEENH